MTRMMYVAHAQQEIGRFGIALFLFGSQNKDDQKKTSALRVIVLRKEPIIASGTEDNGPTLKSPCPLNHT